MQTRENYFSRVIRDILFNSLRPSRPNLVVFIVSLLSARSLNTEKVPPGSLISLLLSQNTDSPLGARPSLVFTLV